MGGRLTKCHACLRELLEEDEAESAELRREQAELNDQIAACMRDIHRQAKGSDVVEAGQQVIKQMQGAWAPLQQKVRGRATDLLNYAKRSHAEAVARREKNGDARP